MTAASNWTPRSDSVPDRAIKWLLENGKTGHRVLSEKIDAERQSMTALLKRSIDSGLIIQTHEQGEYHYDVPHAPKPTEPSEVEPQLQAAEGAKELAAPTQTFLTDALRKQATGTTEEAYERFLTSSAAAAQAIGDLVSTAGPLGEHASPVTGEVVASNTVDAEHADTPEPSDHTSQAAQPFTGELAVSWDADQARELKVHDFVVDLPQVIEIDSIEDLRCAIYSDGRFVIISKDLTVIMHKVPAEVVREYIRKHWPHDTDSGSVRGSM